MGEKLSIGDVAVIDKVIEWEKKDRPVIFRSVTHSSNPPCYREKDVCCIRE